VLAGKRQLLRWACLQNSHLRKVNSCFSVIARLALDAFLSSTPKNRSFLADIKGGRGNNSTPNGLLWGIALRLSAFFALPVL